MLYIVFNNKNTLEDLGLGILTSNEHNRTEEEMEYIEVEGRKKGSLTIRRNNFKDIIIKRTFRIIDKEDLNEKLIKITRWLNNVEDNRLFFSNYTEKCFTVKNATIKNIKDDKGNIFDIDIEFVCEPFLKDLNNDFVEVKNGDIIYNWGDEVAEPNIKFTLFPKYGDVTIFLGGETLEIKNVKDDLIIDTSLFRATSEGMEVKSIGDFPLLQKGANIINFNSTQSLGIQKCEIKKNLLYRA